MCRGARGAAGDRAGYSRPAGPSRLELGRVRVREREESTDGVKLQPREARVGLLRRSSIRFVNQHDIRRHPCAFHHGLPRHLFRIDFHEIAIGTSP